MPRLRPEMEILHVNVCACTCRAHERTGKESVLIMFPINTWDAFCSKGAEARSPGHGGYKSF